jgi:hypothetical protein
MPRFSTKGKKSWRIWQSICLFLILLLFPLSLSAKVTKATPSDLPKDKILEEWDIAPFEGVLVPESRYRYYRSLDLSKSDQLNIEVKEERGFGWKDLFLAFGVGLITGYVASR